MLLQKILWRVKCEYANSSRLVVKAGRKSHDDGQCAQMYWTNLNGTRRCHSTWPFAAPHMYILSLFAHVREHRMTSVQIIIHNWLITTLNDHFPLDAGRRKSISENCCQLFWRTSGWKCAKRVFEKRRIFVSILTIGLWAIFRTQI